MHYLHIAQEKVLSSTTVSLWLLNPSETSSIHFDNIHISTMCPITIALSHAAVTLSAQSSHTERGVKTFKCSGRVLQPRKLQQSTIKHGVTVSDLAMVFAEQTVSLSNGLQQLQDCSMASRRLLALRHANIKTILLPTACTRQYFVLTTPASMQISIQLALRPQPQPQTHSYVALLHVVSGVMVAQFAMLMRGARAIAMPPLQADCARLQRVQQAALRSNNQISHAPIRLGRRAWELVEG